MTYRLMIGQAGLMMAVLLASALAPVPGGMALLLPLPGTDETQMVRFAQGHDLRLVGPGVVRGSIVVSGAGPSRMLSALSHGALLIAVPARMCQTRLDGKAGPAPRISPLDEG